MTTKSIAKKSLAITSRCQLGSSEIYKYYLVFLSTCIVAVAYSDRFLIGLLTQSIKSDLNLSDFQIGAVTGFAFAAFYSLLGVPIGRLADRVDRSTVASISMSIWGVMLILTGGVSSFAQLAAVRAGAAIGESGSMPATYSLIGESFKGRGLTRAMTLYMTSPNLCVLIGFLLGGWINAMYGWRVALSSFGILGICLAAVAKLTIYDPRSSIAGHQKVSTEPVSSMSFLKVMGTLWRNRSYRLVVAGFVFWHMFFSSFWAWVAPVLYRSFQLTTEEISIWLGLGASAAGIAGTWLGGLVFDWRWGGRAKAQVRAAIIAMALVLCLNTLFLTSSSVNYALALIMSLIFVGSSFNGPIFAIVQGLARHEMRATSLSVLLMTMNLVGLSLGPSLVGLASDELEIYLNNEALRGGMLIIGVPTIIASIWCFWRLSCLVSADLADVADAQDARKS